MPSVCSFCPSIEIKEKQSGFTLIELLATLVIITILATVGIPSVRNFILNSRIVTQANDLLADLATARSEAIKRNYKIYLCPTSNPNATPPACDGAAGVWDTGWIMYEDTDGSNSLTTNDKVLRVHGPVAGGNTLRSLATLSPMAYLANGVYAPGGSNYFRLCDSRGTTWGRAIVLDTGGRARVDRIANVGGATCP